MDINFSIYLFVGVFSILSNILIIKYFKFYNYNKDVQTIHSEEISRLSGIVIFISFLLFVFLSGYTSLIKIFFISIIFLIPALLEDIDININPKIRLGCIIIASLILILTIQKLPKFDFILFNSFFNTQFFQIIFFSLALAGVINGQNIIDGTNGLSGLTSLVIFLNILFIAYFVNDQVIINLCYFFILSIICFLIFNYPFGKIFLGDTGSYFLGFASGYLIIFIFGKYEYLPSWIAVIILFYPSFEVIFSYLRKIIKKKSPFKPDSYHLHLKLFFLISRGDLKNKKYNYLIAPMLSIIWLTPILYVYFAMKNNSLSIYLILLQIFIYFLVYFLIPKKEKPSKL